MSIYPVILYPSTSKKRQRKKLASCDLFLEHQLLLSVSGAHSILSLPAEMGTSGANQCQLCWWNLRDGANRVANPENQVETLALWFSLGFLFCFYFIYIFQIRNYTLGAGSLNRDDLVFMSFGGSLAEEAREGFLVWFLQFHLERTDH